MDWYVSLLREDVTYWNPPTRDGYGGYTWGSPTALKGKWEDGESLIYAADGSYTVASTNVWVGVPLEEGGYLFNGSTVVSEPPEGAKQVMSMDSINSLAGSGVVYYKAFLR
jgi:hypothetical protein